MVIFLQVHVLLQVEQQLAGATDGSDDLASSKV